METIVAETEAEKAAEKALFKRLKKHLAEEGFELYRAKSWNYNTGWYYVVDPDTNFIVSGHNSLEELAKIEEVSLETVV